MENVKVLNVSDCCGKHGFILKYDFRLSGTNLYDSEKEGVCPACNNPCLYVEPAETTKEINNL